MSHGSNITNASKGMGLACIMFRDQDHSDLKMVSDTPPFQDASTHQILDFYLK